MLKQSWKIQAEFKVIGILSVINSAAADVDVAHNARN